MSRDTPPEERASLEIRNKLGLHARAAKLFIDTVDPFNAEIMVTKDGQTVNGRSIMGLMMLAAEQGSRIDVVSKGPQAVEVLDAIRTLLDARFNESE